MVEGVALMYIPSIRFELDFYRILCRIFCFGEILPVVRDFCSLSPVSYTFFFSQLLPCRGEQQRKMTIVCIFTWMQWITHRPEMHKDEAVPTLLTLLISLLAGKHCPLSNMLWLSKACVLTVGLLLLAVSPTALSQPAALLSPIVLREINIILCLMSCVPFHFHLLRVEFIHEFIS